MNAKLMAAVALMAAMGLNLADVAAGGVATTVGKAVGRGAEKVVKTVGSAVAKEAGEEAAEEAAKLGGKQLVKIARQQGDEVVQAMRKMGPHGVRAIEETGAHAADALKIYVKYGDDAMWIIANPKRMAIFIRHGGDDVAEAMMRYRELAEELIERFGKSAAQAMKGLSPQQARRLAMMDQAGDLARLGKTEQLLDAIAKGGDKAMDFVWRNKGSLVITAGVLTLIANGGEAVEGAADVGRKVGEGVGKGVGEAIANTNLTASCVCAMSLGAGWLAWRSWLRRPRAAKPPPADAATDDKGSQVAA